jgi:hypothetical protein
MSLQGWCPTHEASCGSSRHPSRREIGWHQEEAAVYFYAIADLEFEYTRSLGGISVLWL